MYKKELISSSFHFSPAYFPDIVVLLRAMDCEQFIPKFAMAKVSLEEFLAITDKRLSEIGIEFPFQRALIKFGLLKFYKINWSNTSLFLPQDFENENISSYDFVLMLANITRQLIVIKSHIVYMKQLGEEYDLTRAYNYFSLKFLTEFQCSVSNLETQIIAMTEPQTRPLLIKKSKVAIVAESKTVHKTQVLKFGIFAALPIIIISFSLLKK